MTLTPFTRFTLAEGPEPVAHGVVWGDRTAAIRRIGDDPGDTTWDDIDYALDTHCPPGTDIHFHALGDPEPALGEDPLSTTAYTAEVTA
ncbi:hypothetical protein ACIBUR_09470 [Streptomyces anulatus]